MLFYRLRPKPLLKLEGYRIPEEWKYHTGSRHCHLRSPLVWSITSSDTKFWFRLDVDDSNYSGDESDVSSLKFDD